jgi:hypothetical protein
MPEVHYTRKLSCAGCANSGEVVADTMGRPKSPSIFNLKTPPRLEGALLIICGKCGSSIRGLGLIGLEAHYNPKSNCTSIRQRTPFPCAL